ncbi:hypothetical protein HYR69_01580, partial [Candidatus Sumerlaeota bacterium]|nr:hypothetical protein [Candidatus Sumerlaeota bacterium]
MLIISFVEWAGAFQRPQHMAVGFARRGWNVTYVSPGYIHRRSQQIESGVELPPTLKIMNPMAFPGATKLGFVGAINESNLTRAIRRNNHRNGGAWDALIFNDPRWSGIAAEIPAKVKIFDGMDDLSAYTPDLDYLKRKEDDAIRLSSRIWTGTSIMAER